ncbi:MAG: biopolymer transporter ExbD [Proteiniphilum sp.]|jgi:biopolymer transport protein ExbD|uniref:ExbD/TolR family protein n=1 Tax=Proteiniphilum sp. TaxID=1926877 RepID=UPI00092CC483|nr:biopolymer transporter ExbD [Proteiniphilum sp.]MEA5126885.1 biopolymer transporter ExbD [Proteiniphilum sp.]OJV81671.1 MAG: biopolymer transporter ExbD [Bacteroidia bacterium 44-10]
MAKVQKHSVFIDMTAMSDVTVLLLTFFMLTSTFLPLEPVRVTAPASVMEIKVPDYNVINILVDLQGKVFVNIDRTEVRLEALEKMSDEYGITLDDRQKKAFLEQPYIGVPMNRLPAFLDLPFGEQDATMRQYGIPNDSTNNQFINWIRKAREIDSEMKITIKADQTTPYPLIESVMKDLVKIKANRYSLVTVLRGAPEGF